MSSLTGHLSLFATQSLKSIDKWMATANANLNGSLRNSFKESTLTYGGNTVSILKETSQTVNGIQIGEQALTVGHTDTNWQTGEIVSSTQDTHLAIKGDGFFIVADPRTTNWSTTPLYFNGTGTGGGQKAYLTKDGEFHWAVVKDASGNAIAGGQLVLVNKEGLVAVADEYPIGSDNWMAPVTHDAYYNTTSTDNAQVRPSVVVPSYDALDNTPVNIITDYAELQYSKYGSTIYEAPTANSFKTIINGSNRVLNSRYTNGEDSGSSIVENALESSNVNFDSNIAQLAALGKMYNGFVQVIKVYNSALDEVLGFIR